jgi:TRAP-type C4-dicarboxylate transport system permease small subunit
LSASRRRFGVPFRCTTTGGKVRCRATARKRGEHESSLPGPLGWIDSLISRFESFALAAGVLLMAFNTCANVIGRFGFGHSFFFTGELNRAIIVLITFAGVGYAARHGRHIRMSAIYDALPFLGRKVLMIMIAIVTSLAMFALCYFSVIYINDVSGLRARAAGAAGSGVVDLRMGSSRILRYRNPVCADRRQEHRGKRRLPLDKRRGRVRRNRNRSVTPGRI